MLKPASNELEQKIEHYFADEIRPVIQLDGGDIHLLGITKVEEGYIVRVTLAGACVGCGLSAITLNMGVELRLKEKFPEVVKLEVI